MTPPNPTEIGKSLLAAFASPFAQNNRKFTMAFAQDSNIAPDLLLPHHMYGIERIFGTYLYVVEALSPNVHLKAEKFLARPVQLAIRLADGSERMVAGVVTSFGQLSSDGGMTRYALHIEPCLAVLAHSYNACVRQDMTVSDILLDVLNHHLQNNVIVKRSFQVGLRITNKLPTLSYATQHESDLHYVERLMAQYGLFYFFEFYNDNGHPVHKMIITDDQYRVEAGVHPVMRFAGAHAGENTLTQWSGMRCIQPGMVSLTSFEYKNVSVDRASAHSRVDQGDAGNQLMSTLHDFDPQTHYFARGGDDLDRHATHRQQAYDYQTQQYTGITSDPGLAPFTSFEFRGHPAHDQENQEKRQFVIVSLVSEARNNLPQETEASLARLMRAKAGMPDVLAPWFGNEQRLLDDPRQQPYGNVITCVRRDTPIRPRYAHTDYAKPAAPGMVTATVVGPEGGDEVFTDEHGRVQVEFHFERFLGNRATGSASKTRARCWVRVLCIAAGQYWGSSFTPRVGQEVAILYLHGDLDKLVCIGVMPNGTHLKSHFSNAGSLPNNKMQSGFKGKENQGHGYNQWVMDDTTRQLSMQVMSSHAQTKLHQGWLGTPRADGKSDPRGEGIELVTQAAGAIRTAGPLLLTTEPAPHNGPHLTRTALMQVLSAALALVESNGDLAAELGANKPETGRNDQLVDDDAKPGAKADTGHQTHVKEAVDNLERGYNNDPDGKTGKGHQRGGQRILGLSSVDGTAIASQKSITTAAGANLDSVAQRDTNQTTGRRWIHTVRESISLFVDGSRAKIKDTFKIIAATGNVKVQAQNGEINATAQKDFIVTSVGGKVIVQAPEEILLMAGGSYIRIGKNIEVHGPANYSMKAARYTMTGPTSLHPQLPEMPAATPQPFNKKFVLTGFDRKPAEGMEIKLFDPEKKAVVWQNSLAPDGSAPPIPEKGALEKYTAIAGFKEGNYHFSDAGMANFEEEHTEKFEDDHGAQ